MMKSVSKNGLHAYYLLWSTQVLSALGSAMTVYALVLWSYQQSGSALQTALLSVCSYAPYVVLSIFAGSLTDRWNRKAVMLVCDTAAALSTLCVLVLLEQNRLELWHLYALNALSGLMNTFQQPASEVATTLLVPKESYHRVSALQAMAGSLNTILTPVIATALIAFSGLRLVIWIDLATFCIAFFTLLFFIRIPRVEEGKPKESVLRSAKEGLNYLRGNRGVLNIILFLSAINLVASMYEAALPALMLSRPGAGQEALGWIKSTTGFAYLVGSVLVTVTKPPKNKVRVIYWTLVISMCTENLVLALGRGLSVWCLGAVMGWLPIPFMNTNLNVLMREQIPVELQARVYSTRNSLQFFTIPLGYLLGGMFIDNVLEPFMAAQTAGSPLISLLGSGKGSGAALLFLFMELAGVLICLLAARVEPFRGLFQASKRKAKKHSAI
ncbi:MAG: MFS transporter [Eubacteriales bacterium]|nr:MFS transporter [Eubacteriales bacterium]